MASIRRVQLEEPHTVMGMSSSVELSLIEVIHSLFTTREQGHSSTSVLQVSVWDASPEHGAPPLAGAGLLHCLVRVRVPPPQVLLQEEKELQEPQPPLIAKERLDIVDIINNKKINKDCLHYCLCFTCEVLTEKLSFGMSIVVIPFAILTKVCWNVFLISTTIIGLVCCPGGKVPVSSITPAPYTNTILVATYPGLFSRCQCWKEHIGSIISYWS